jgi:hypothetical protein
VSIEDTAQTKYDNHLQASRRLDWRFLFPQVALGKVAYIGSRDEILIEALQAFSDELHINQDDKTSLSNVDYLIMLNPSLSRFRQLLALMKPQARFYVEFKRSRYALTLNRLPSLYALSARQAGFIDTQMSWHWPNFAEANRIIPLESPEGLQNVFAKGRKNWRTQAKLFGISQLVRTKMLHSLVSCLSLIGEKGVKVL